MTPRRAVTGLALALALVTTVAATSEARAVGPASPGPVDTYRVSLTLPTREAATAIVLVEHDDAKLTGMLILDGSPAATLQDVRIADNILTARVATTAGEAQLTMELQDGTGKGQLVLRAAAARR